MRGLEKSENRQAQEEWGRGDDHATDRALGSLQRLHERSKDPSAHRSNRSSRALTHRIFRGALNGVHHNLQQQGTRKSKPYVHGLQPSKPQEFISERQAACSQQGWMVMFALALHSLAESL